MAGASVERAKMLLRKRGINWVEVDGEYSESGFVQTTIIFLKDFIFSFLSTFDFLFLCFFCVTS